MRRTLALLTAILCAAPALAHESYRITGAVSGIRDSQLYISPRGALTKIVTMDRFTRITRGAETLGVSALRSGQEVIVSAVGDSEDDLTALHIQLVDKLGSE